MSTTIHTKPVVPCFESVEALREGLQLKSQFEPVDLYPRDGTIALSDTEAAAAKLIDVASDQVVVFNTGMSAVATAIETGLDISKSEQPTIACAEQLYSQTAAILGNLATNRGIKLVRFDSGWTDDVVRVIEQKSPDIVLTETVGNGPDTPVANIANILELTREHRITSIIDNTLPLNTGYDVASLTSPEDKVITVESGTKSYTFNREMSGFAYSKNTDLLFALRGKRRTYGTMPGLASVERINALLPESKQAFDARNLQILQKAGDVAIRLSKEISNEGTYFVSHPTLESHDSAELPNQLTRNRVSPLFFLQCRGCDDQFELASKLWVHPEVQAQAELGQSFGFDTARILPDERGRNVRISLGAFTEVSTFTSALAEALSKS